MGKDILSGKFRGTNEGSISAGGIERTCRFAGSFCFPYPSLKIRAYFSPILLKKVLDFFGNRSTIEHAMWMIKRQ